MLTMQYDRDTFSKLGRNLSRWKTSQVYTLKSALKNVGNEYEITLILSP